ncbi:hypothetical protein L484_005990 [Morus notabilis]|uniref:Uncharacterized protein n=1 Tax=Morus notabilis TaxID=981085 RepID=W9REQ3_9ROSA|nr:hypothetical protein L484_005990 [Morus notabilis]
MQHPNCRKVENGQWLYAKVSTRSFPQFSTDNWIPDEDPYDMGYAEMVYGQPGPFDNFIRNHQKPQPTQIARVRTCSLRYSGKNDAMK